MSLPERGSRKTRIPREESADEADANAPDGLNLNPVYGGDTIMAAVRQKFGLATTGRATQEIPTSKACAPGKGVSERGKGKTTYREPRKK